MREKRIADEAEQLTLLSIAWEVRKSFPHLSEEEIVSLVGLPPFFGAPALGRWFGGGTSDTVYGVCDRCYTVTPARDLRIQKKPFSREDERVCRSH